MTVIFIAILWLLFVLGQSVILPAVFGWGFVYDLTIPIVVYLALFRPSREGAVLVFALGLTMEGLSGGPFGIYMTAYYWLFIVLKWLISLFNVQSTLLIPFVVAAGVALENAVVVFMMSAGGSAPMAIDGVLRHMVIQVLWALPTGPVILIVIRNLQGSFERRVVERFRTSDI
ncbi:MAG: hypothetical protein ABIL58_03415 [Pseudomonadota bacterium]